MTDPVQLRVQKPRGLLAKAFAKLFLRQATVVSNRRLATGFHLIELEGPDLKTASWTPGQQIQIGMTAFSSRTYTPIGWDTDNGRTRILAYAHGTAPGSDWVRAARTGTDCEFFGPRGSLDLDGAATAKLIFGDETSFGLACSALHPAAGPARCLFEVNLAGVARSVLAAMGIEDAELFERQADDAHLAAIERRLPAFAADGATFVLTGQAKSIQRLRQALKAMNVPSSRIMAKAYWAPGKTGMD
ncbi:MAG: siderophore-interacting protein [Tardiphaga sp.]